MTLTLLEGDHYVVLGSNQEYLGNVESDDFETSSYDIYVDDGDVDLQFQVDYKDAYNNEYNENFTLNLPVYTKQEVKMYGLDGSTTSIFSLIFYVLIILFVYYAIKSWRQEKKIDTACKNGFCELLKVPFRILFFFKLSNLAKIPRKLRDFFKSI